jgi:hypothetical protein
VSSFFGDLWNEKCPEKAGLVYEPKDQGCPAALGDYRIHATKWTLTDMFAFHKLCGIMTTALNIYSTEDKSLHLGACLHMHHCVITRVSVQSLSKDHFVLYSVSCQGLLHGVKLRYT